MNLSIFTSEVSWRRLCQATAWWLAGFLFLVSVLILGADPFDTGHFALFPVNGVPHFGQRLADASLGRDRQFNLALIGNSTLQLLDPSRLTASHAHAVSLTIPGTGPIEQLTVARYFLRQHQGEKNLRLVIGLSNRWCEKEGLALQHPFPFWLYSDNLLTYAFNMLQAQSLDAVMRKLEVARKNANVLAADGFNDYDQGKAWTREAFWQRLNDGNEEEGSREIGDEYPAQDLLQKFLSEIPASIEVVLVVPPRFHDGEDPKMKKAQVECHRSLANLATRTGPVRFIDFDDDRDLKTGPIDFWDRAHYRRRLAHLMELRIAATLQN